jgi:hydrogenase maturation protease
MAKALIIGYGNPLRGDDGLGWHAAQHLALVLGRTDVDIMSCHQLTPELAEPVSGAAVVIFIDAAEHGVAGRLACRRVTPEPSLPGALSHHLTPRRLLACAQAFYGTCPEAFLLSVTGAFFGYGERLSPPVEAAVPPVVEAVQALVAGRERQSPSVPATRLQKPVDWALR